MRIANRSALLFLLVLQQGSNNNYFGHAFTVLPSSTTVMVATTTTTTAATHHQQQQRSHHQERQQHQLSQAIHRRSPAPSPTPSSASWNTRILSSSFDDFGGGGQQQPQQSYPNLDIYELYEDDVDYVSDAELEATMGEWDDRIARFNTVHLTGRVGSDPEPRYLDDGKVVVNLSLATTRKYHSAERKLRDLSYGDEETDWYRLEIWGQTAEFVAKFVDKGSRVGVVGSLQVDEWTDRESGTLRNAVKVIVRDFDVLETRDEAERRRARRGGGGGGQRRSSGDDEGSWGGPSPAGSGDFF